MMTSYDLQYAHVNCIVVIGSGWKGLLLYRNVNIKYEVGWMKTRTWTEAPEEAGGLEVI